MAKKTTKAQRFQIYESCLQKWGRFQIPLAIEEMAELTRELCKISRCNSQEIGDRKSLLAEEMADVFLMLEQITYAFRIEGLVKEFKEIKITRLKKRLEGKEGK